MQPSQDNTILDAKMVGCVHAGVNPVSGSWDAARMMGCSDVGMSGY